MAAAYGRPIGARAGSGDIFGHERRSEDRDCGFQTIVGPFVGPYLSGMGTGVSVPVSVVRAASNGDRLPMTTNRDGTQVPPRLLCARQAPDSISKGGEYAPRRSSTDSISP